MMDLCLLVRAVCAAACVAVDDEDDDAMSRHMWGSKSLTFLELKAEIRIENPIFLELCHGQRIVH